MEGPFKQFVAYIDPDNKFNLTDKLSQVFTPKSMPNLTKKPFNHNNSSIFS